jgi:hypothetical protein
MKTLTEGLQYIDEPLAPPAEVGLFIVFLAAKYLLIFLLALSNFLIDNFHVISGWNLLFILNLTHCLCPLSSIDNLL